MVEEINVETVNRLLFAGSYVVCETLGTMKKTKGRGEIQKPCWQRRLESSILQWRKDIGRVNEIKIGTKLKEKINLELNRRYNLVERGTKNVTSFLQNKIKSASTKIRNYIDKNKTTRQIFFSGQTRRDQK